MLRFTKVTGILAAGVVALMWALPAQAQATRTWVSGVGDDVNPCSRTAPCKTFPGAISKTAAGGEIDTLDPGGFGAVTVVKAITLANEGIGEAGILVAGTNGVTVNAGSGDVIILRGLQIDGGPLGSNSLAGVRFMAGRALEVQNCTIRNFTGGSPNGFGVSFTPSGVASLYITDTTLTTNGQIGNASSGGIFVAPSAGGSAVKVTLRNVNAIQNAGFGLLINTTSAPTGAGSILAVATDSSFDGNGGIGVNVITPASTEAATLSLTSITSSNNTTAGVVANGATAIVRMGRSTITGNATGIAGIGGGKMFSYVDNEVNSNTTSDGTATLPNLSPL